MQTKPKFCQHPHCFRWATSFHQELVGGAGIILAGYRCDDHAPKAAALPPANGIEASRNPIVRITDTNEAMADSRDVAAYFGKQHFDVLRAIRNLNCSKEFGARNFAFTNEFNELANRDVNFIMMTKDGFSFLGMGFTGATAGAFKEQYIAAFNVMEAELRNRAPAPAPAFPVPQSFVQALELALDQQRQIERQQAEIVTLAPKAEFFDRFVNADGLYGYQNAARALGCRPNKFVDWLKQKYCFYAGDALLPYVLHLNSGHFAVKNLVCEDGKARPRGFITPKGLEYFSSRVPADIKISEIA
jgi:anti-repressor protein